MRSELVDNYFAEVMKSTGGGSSQVFKEIYKNIMDNRIFNNLKQQLNEMIEDEKSLISVDEFRKMFFTFFKGEYKAMMIYEKVLPFVTVWNVGENVYDAESQIPESETPEAERMVSVQKLTIFIDSFNFFPVKVDKIHFKNTSQEMTHVMTSN